MKGGTNDKNNYVRKLLIVKLNINGWNPQMTKQMKQMSLYRRTNFNQKENIPL